MSDLSMRDRLADCIDELLASVGIVSTKSLCERWVDSLLTEMENPSEGLVAFVAAQYVPPTSFQTIVRQDIKTIVRAIKEGK